MFKELKRRFQIWLTLMRLRRTVRKHTSTIGFVDIRWKFVFNDGYMAFSRPAPTTMKEMSDVLENVVRALRMDYPNISPYYDPCFRDSDKSPPDEL